MKRWTIKHEPTKKFYYEDESGSFLVDIEYSLPFKTEKEAKEMYEWYIVENANSNNGNVITEDGDYPLNEFKVVPLQYNVKEL